MSDGAVVHIFLHFRIVEHSVKKVLWIISEVELFLLINNRVMAEYIQERWDLTVEFRVKHLSVSTNKNGNKHLINQQL